MKGQKTMVNILMTIQSEHGVKRPIDDSLILTVAKGDMDAFHELYESVSKSVYGFALSIIKNSHDAEDVLQETFLRIYASADRYVPQGKPMAWIFTVTRNLAMSKLRENSRTAEYDESKPEKIDFTLVSDVEQRLVLEKVFTVLSDEEKQILILHAVSGMKHREIASVLDMSVNTVLSKYHRAVKKLRIAVEEEQK